MSIVSKYFRGYRLVISLMVLCIYLGTTMCNSGNKGNEKEKKDVYGVNDNYIGSQTCASCHKQIHDIYTTARHFKTSALIDAANFNDTYTNKDSVFYNINLYVSAHQNPDGIYQTAYSGGRVAANHKMDLVIGSGRKGQTFLFWNDSSLYQLPLSYSFAYNRWINSPGYPADKVMFNRVIPVKCFECHASYTEQNINQQSKPIFDSSRMVLSISCETCHGPGKKHIQYHKDNPDAKHGNFIINAAKLNRQQQLEACASCHSGIRENLKPAFTFLPGNNLDEFFKPAIKKDSTAPLDVHGNQYGLLTESKCFKQSVVLNCSSCHNVHQQESNAMQLFAQRCMSCHNDGNNNFCTVKNTPKQVLINQCIDCHMPKQASSQITFNAANAKQFLYDSIRTHLIGIYKPNAVLVKK
jgi:Cytochrome c554 and c-prime